MTWALWELVCQIRAATLPTSPETAGGLNERVMYKLPGIQPVLKCWIRKQDTMSKVHNMGKEFKLMPRQTFPLPSVPGPCISPSPYCWGQLTSSSFQAHCIMCQPVPNDSPEVYVPIGKYKGTSSPLPCPGFRDSLWAKTGKNYQTPGTGNTDCRQPHFVPHDPWPSPARADWTKGCRPTERQPIHRPARPAVCQAPLTLRPSPK